MRTAQETYHMLGQTPLWDTALSCHAALDEMAIPHAVIGGVAVCLHGYQRSTVDLDLLVRPNDTVRIKAALESAGFRWNSEHSEFRTNDGVPVQLLLCGSSAGRDSGVKLPDPSLSKTVVDIEGLPVVTLAKLIEMKVACGSGNLRRTHKDFADVVELIVANGLGKSFARYLHKSVRSAFRDLVERTRGDSE